MFSKYIPWLMFRSPDNTLRYTSSGSYLMVLNDCVNRSPVSHMYIFNHQCIPAFLSFQHFR